MSRKKTVLLVEEVKLFLEMEKSFLNRSDIQAVALDSCRDALETLEGMRPDLVIMEMGMAFLDGGEYCRRLKDDPGLPKVPLILVAREDEPVDRERCRTLGCDAILVRPLSRRQLLATARDLLALAERAIPRIPSRLLVRYGLLAPDERHDYSFNLSEGGLFLETPLELTVGTELALEFLVPGTERQVLCRGRVTWINDGVKPDLPRGAGVRFLDLGAPSVEVVRDLVRSIQGTDPAGRIAGEGAVSCGKRRGR